MALIKSARVQKVTDFILSQFYNNVIDLSAVIVIVLTLITRLSRAPRIDYTSLWRQHDEHTHAVLINSVQAINRASYLKNHCLV